jgi:pimeloyl-ACP methyl ester carboxylesterase
MPRLTRPDGAELEWRIEGHAGPLVALTLMALHPPGVCRRLVEDLSADHRVLVYELRGTAGSSRTPPYDMDTDAADLAAVVEETGGDALVIAVGDGARRAVRAAADRPDLIHTVVVSGEAPLGTSTRAGGHEALSHSPAVLEALLALLESDYRAGLRTMLGSSGESEWHGMALHDRIDAMAAHCPHEVAVARLRAWTGDDSIEHARSLGGRLWFLHYPGNAWFQGSLDGLRRDLPEAHFEEVPDGVLTRPEENAAEVRRILAARRTAV